MNILKTVLTPLIILLMLFATGLTDSKSGEEINWQVISSGGNKGTSANFQLNGTMGQTAVGLGSSTNFGINHGYWQDFGGGGIICDCEPGNANGDVLINIFDITYVISYLYKGGPPPTPYPICSGDPNGLGCTCNIFDITYLISFLYKGGPIPVTCEAWLIACGPPLR